VVVKDAGYGRKILDKYGRQIMEHRGFSVPDWARKLAQQAEESKEYRHGLYEKADLKNRERVLDIGCGTGDVTMDIAGHTDGGVVGIDIDDEKLEIARKYVSSIENLDIMKGDMCELPFDDESFDLVVFNIVLVYVKDQQKAVDEAARVTRKGGMVMATLEPDYEGDLRYPPDPAREIHLKWMKDMGADLRCGRKLKYLFTTAGLDTEVGIDVESDYVYIRDRDRKLKLFRDQKWVMEKILSENGWPPERIEGYLLKQEDLLERGLQFHFPTAFYAIGRK
jgi:SAM-dependent methyltransferase